jgi:hypothetical protein
MRVDEVLPARVLLHGFVLSASVPTRGYSSGFAQVRAGIRVTADREAVALLGLRDTEYAGVFGAMFQKIGSLVPVPPDAFQIGQSHEAGINLTAVPEPPTWLLLGTVGVLSRTMGRLRARKVS